MSESPQVQKIKPTPLVSTQVLKGNASSPKAIIQAQAHGEISSAHHVKISDDELRKLIKSLGLPVDDKMILTSRFLIRNRFSLDAENLKLGSTLLPKDAALIDGQAGKALLLALSRLPLYRVAECYPMMHRALNGHPQQMWSWIHVITQSLGELELFCLGQDLKGQDWLIEGFRQEISGCEQCLRRPELQMLLLIERWQLLRSLQSLRQSALLIRRLQKCGHMIGGPQWERPLSKVIEASILGEELLQVDAILSLEDDDQHFKEKGACVGLSIWLEKPLLPCRLWDESSGEHEIDASAPWVFRLQWEIEGQGELEVVLRIHQGDVSLCWESESQDCLSCLKEIAPDLNKLMHRLEFKLDVITYLYNSELEAFGGRLAKQPARDNLMHIDSNA